MNPKKSTPQKSRRKSNQTTSKKRVRDVDTYIASAPKEARASLTLLRSTILSTAPEAEEIISYNMPYYKYRGALAGFAVYKNHISFFGTLPDELKEELEPYGKGRGTIRFPLKESIPVPLVKKLIKLRMVRNEIKSK